MKEYKIGMKPQPQPIWHPLLTRRDAVFLVWILDIRYFLVSGSWFVPRSPVYWNKHPNAFVESRPWLASRAGWNFCRLVKSEVRPCHFSARVTQGCWESCWLSDHDNSICLAYYCSLHSLPGTVVSCTVKSKPAQTHTFHWIYSYFIYLREKPRTRRTSALISANQNRPEADQARKTSLKVCCRTVLVRTSSLKKRKWSAVRLARNHVKLLDWLNNCHDTRSILIRFFLSLFVCLLQAFRL